MNKLFLSIFLIIFLSSNIFSIENWTTYEMETVDLNYIEKNLPNLLVNNSNIDNLNTLNNNVIENKKEINSKNVISNVEGNLVLVSKINLLTNLIIALYTLVFALIGFIIYGKIKNN